MKLLANKVHMQGMKVLLVDKVYKQELQHKINGYISHNHPYMNSSK